MLSECIAQVEKIEEKVEGLQKIVVVVEEEEELDHTQHHYHQLKLL